MNYCLPKTSLVTLLTGMVLALVPALQAADIVGLCIGNDRYLKPEDRLDTPVADAGLMKKALESLPGGADVTLLTDASHEQMVIALNALAQKARGAKLVFVFYSGHGLEGQPAGFARSDTFLLPVEADIPSVDYLPTRAISVQEILNTLKDCPVTARAVVLDCCRTGAPKAVGALAGTTKSVGDIDAAVKAALGDAVLPEATLVAFSASPGRKAAAFLKDTDENSPFTWFLANGLRTGNGSLMSIVAEASIATEQATGRRQLPELFIQGSASALYKLVLRTGPESSVWMPLPEPQPTPEPVDPFAGSHAGESKRNGLGMPLRWCPPGEFWMGSPESEEGRYDDEVRHKVALTRGYWLGQHEVMQGEWEAVMGRSLRDQARLMLEDDTLYRLGGKDQTLRDWMGTTANADLGTQVAVEYDEIPIYYVNWEEAEEFCRKLTERERSAGRLPVGWAYRLPTEAEWEYACRAGSSTALYTGGLTIRGENDGPELDGIAWYGGNSSEGYEGRGWITDSWTEKQYPGGTAGPRRVGQKEANGWGLHDMIGNVWEWCGDRYGTYPETYVTDPSGLPDGSYRVLRGGSWDDNARNCRAALRSRDTPSIRYDYLGFRVAVSSTQ